MKVNFLNECLEIQDKENEVITMDDLQNVLECSIAFIEKLKDGEKVPAALRSLIDLKAVNIKGFIKLNEKITSLASEVVNELPFS